MLRAICGAVCAIFALCFLPAAIAIVIFFVAFVLPFLGFLWLSWLLLDNIKDIITGIIPVATFIFIIWILITY